MCLHTHRTESAKDCADEPPAVRGDLTGAMATATAMASASEPGSGLPHIATSDLFKREARTEASAVSGSTRPSWAPSSSAVGRAPTPGEGDRAPAETQNGAPDGDCAFAGVGNGRTKPVSAVLQARGEEASGDMHCGGLAARIAWMDLAPALTSRRMGAGGIVASSGSATAEDWRISSGAKAIGRGEADASTEGCALACGDAEMQQLLPTMEAVSVRTDSDALSASSFASA